MVGAIGKCGFQYLCRESEETGVATAMESILGLEYENFLILFGEALNPLYEISHHFFARPARKILSSLCTKSI